jgi:hypothetical protein
LGSSPLFYAVVLVSAFLVDIVLIIYTYLDERSGSRTL